mgnify:CR=1
MFLRDRKYLCCHPTFELRSKRGILQTKKNAIPESDGARKKRKSEENERNFPELVWIFSLEVGNRVGK